MKNGIAVLSVIPIRKEPTHASEQISQLLFGETYSISSTHETWLKITCNSDGYEGWIHNSQHTALADKDFTAIAENKAGIALELAFSASSSSYSVPVVCGSSLPGFDGVNFKIGKEKFIYNGQAVLPEAQNSSVLERIALRYLNAPYQWGGRSPFGIDCSGFSQIVFKFCGYSLKRDAYQQAEQGTPLNFVEETQPGDLAFFANDENRITHVGIILKDHRIIHASGKVRIDKLDHYGIYNAETKKYSHRLKLIKRYF
ncbi:MAG: C40 family peptidase [Chitinophagales bacterium]|nr:C40 family peptidase [Chitinophagales bacterium]